MGYLAPSSENADPIDSRVRAAERAGAKVAITLTKNVNVKTEKLDGAVRESEDANELSEYYQGGLFEAHRNATEARRSMMFAIMGDVKAVQREEGAYPPNKDWITKAGIERPLLSEDSESEWPSLLPYYWSGQVDDDFTRGRLFSLRENFMKEKQNSKKSRYPACMLDVVGVWL